MMPMDRLHRRIRINRFGRSTGLQRKRSLLKGTHHAPPHHPPKTAALPSLVLAEPFRHPVEWDALLELGEGFEGLAMLLA